MKKILLLILCGMLILTSCQIKIGPWELNLGGKAEPETSSVAESKSESKPAESEDSSEKPTESKTESKAESKTESKAESKAESKTESQAESKPESKPESKVESKEESKPESKPTSSAASSSSTVSSQTACEHRTWNEATCTVAKVCASCGKTSGAPLGHSYSESVTPSTCAMAGVRVRTCQRCQKTEQTKLALADHSWSNWITVKEATEQEEGQKSRTCSVCQKVETQKIARLPMTPTAMQLRILELVNEERVKAGVAPLTYCYVAQNAADVRAQEIIQSFSHTRPNGTSCFTTLEESGILLVAAGENIAKGQRSPEEVVTAWMNSQGHRENILYPDFEQLAVGIAEVNGYYYWVQLFVTQYGA